jgi:hypothetical protein
VALRLKALKGGKLILPNPSFTDSPQSFSVESSIQNEYVIKSNLIRALDFNEFS